MDRILLWKHKAEMKKARWIIVSYLPPSPDWIHEFFGIILKPIKMNELLSILQKCISSESPNQSLMDMKRLFKPNQILLVEDNLANQKLTALIINRIGYEVDVACNGVEAVEKTKENEYSLILMDCHMPVMDGFQATSIIRETEKKVFFEENTNNFIECECFCRIQTTVHQLTNGWIFAKANQER